MVVWPDGGLGFLLVALMVTASSAYASNASQDTIAVFQAVVEAVKAVEHPLTGKGSALVQINRPASVLQRPPTGEDAAARQIDLHSRHLSSAKTDFVFKGLLSRSTRRNMAEDGRAQPLVTWVVGDRCAITYNSSGTGWAIVRREPELPFYRQIGYDFNPRTFMRHETTPLAELLERVLKGPATLSTRMDADGILHLIAEYRSPKQHEHTVISVDPAKGYRLTTYLCSMESLDQPGRSFTEFTEIQWADYGPACYVKTVNRSVYGGIHSWEDKPSLSTSDLLKSIDVSVSEFQPNIEIDDAEFTLQGLRLPQGTEVIDEISGVTYRIGGGDL